MEHIIPASEFTRNFGRYQMLAQRAPIAVTTHGRTTGYFIAAEDYEAFKRFHDSRRTFATSDLPEKSATSPGPQGQRNLAASIRARFAPLGGVELPTMPRDAMRPPPNFDE